MFRSSTARRRVPSVRLFSSTLAAPQLTLFSPADLEAVKLIADARSSATLQEKVVIENSLDHFTSSEIEAAYKELQLPSPFAPYAPIITEDELYAAFEKRNSVVEHPTRRRVLLEAAKVVAKYAKSDVLSAIIESVPMPMAEGETSVALVKAKMDPARAYVALGAEEGMDDETIEMIYPIRVRPFPLVLFCSSGLQ
jgi:hypothetical protein